MWWSERQPSAKSKAPLAAGRWPLATNRIFAIALAALAVLLFAGCRQQMAETGRIKPLEPSPAFEDQRSARPLVEGTVAREQLRADQAFYTGKVGNQEVSVFPLSLSLALVKQGREGFDIFCAPCHGRAGYGDGMVVRRGFPPPPSYHTDRLREAPVGHFFDVMTHGFGSMPDYVAQVTPEERWAIAAYIRALQLSQGAKVADLPAADRQRIEQAR